MQKKKAREYFRRKRTYWDKKHDYYLGKLFKSKSSKGIRKYSKKSATALKKSHQYEMKLIDTY